MVRAKDKDLIDDPITPIEHLEASIALCLSTYTDKEIKVKMSNKILHIYYDLKQPIMCTLCDWISLAKVHHLKEG